MIYSKFGSRLTLVSKHQPRSGELSIQARAGDAPEIREYVAGDMKADGGAAEIDQVIASLPWKVVNGKKIWRGQQNPTMTRNP